MSDVLDHDGGKTTSYRVLEFYSGIGGMRYSLIAANVNARVVEAFDINNVANDVYEHNFGHRPHQGNIQTLNVSDLDRYAANVWLLSPPCQPYTRQGLRKQSNDSRAFSFIKILELIPQAKVPPSMVLVENVVGFEVSDTRAKMIEILKCLNFVILEFILSPLQFGIPYSRPRYYCLAKREPSLSYHQFLGGGIISSPDLLFGLSTREGARCDHPCSQWDPLHLECEPIENFLELRKSCCQVDVGYSSIPLNSRNEQIDDIVNLYRVPLGTIERWGSAMDIVYPDSKRCCCFTKSYYRYVKGTGSILATATKGEEGETCLEHLGLRFFTPREVANLHSFPKHFEFPAHISLKQCYALLGNSLSIAVVASLLRYLFHEAS